MEDERGRGGGMEVGGGEGKEDGRGGEEGVGERWGEQVLTRSQVYNKVTIKWTTHSARALTEKDTDMARACDDIAEEIEPGRNT